MRRRLADLDGRVLAGAAVAVFFLVFTSFSHVHGSAPWRSIGVDARKTRFEDLQSVTSSWDCTRRGIQPFPGNPCDPYGRPANYPRMWTHFGVFGLGLGDTVPLGIAQISVGYAPVKNQSELLRQYFAAKGVMAVIVDKRQARVWAPALDRIAKRRDLGGVLFYRVGGTKGAGC